MKFLQKNNDSKILSDTLKYSNVADRGAIRAELLKEQKGFCAYTEEYFKNSETKEIEHFYPKAENPDKEDDYFNWYLVKDHANKNRPRKIRDYLPIIQPSNSNLKNRLKYLKGTFRFEEDKNDMEIYNFIQFLNLNRYELVKDREKHLKRVLNLRKMAKTEDEFFETLKSDNYYLSYITILEKELDIELDKYISA